MTSYVIQIVDAQNETKYFAYDAHSGGYPWFPDRMWSAHHFSSMSDALKEFNNMVHGKNSNWSNGTVGAPSELRNVFSLCNTRTKNSGWVHIVAISGSRWSEISATLVHGRFVEVEEFRNEKGKDPIVNIRERQ